MNFEKTCIPCRQYHLLNITRKNITTVSFLKVFTEERIDRKHFFTAPFLRLKPLEKILYNKRIPTLSWKMSRTLQHLRAVLEIVILKFAIKILEKLFEEVHF